MPPSADQRPIKGRGVTQLVFQGSTSPALPAYLGALFGDHIPLNALGRAPGLTIINVAPANFSPALVSEALAGILHLVVGLPFRPWVAQTFTEKAGAYVCGTCGTTLCANVHKKDVENVGVRGYWKSPCPRCGASLLDGFILAAPPAGAFEDAAADEPAGADYPTAGRSELEGPSITAMKWTPTRRLRNEVLALTCPHCHDERVLAADSLRPSPPEGVEGLARKPFSVGSSGLIKLLAFAVGVTAFVWVHWSLYGPQLQIGIPLLLPALAAVVAYNLVQPLLGAMPFLAGQKLQVYGCACGTCGTEITFASDGKSLALPVEPTQPASPSTS